MSRQCLQRSDVFYLTLQRFTVSTYIGDGLQSEDFQTFSILLSNLLKNISIQVFSNTETTTATRKQKNKTLVDRK